MKQKCANCP